LGPGPIEPHIEHAHAFSRVLGGRLELGATVADLGSGAGVPGLVLAMDLPSVSITLIEAGLRRVQHLQSSIIRCGLTQRVEVVHQRAEAFGALAASRASFHAVVARSFGKPAVTAECAAPLLQVGGWLVVSEPPDGSNAAIRWPEGPLEALGLRLVVEVEGPARLAVLQQVELCPDRFPRRVGVAAKRPLF
jgi:16S rRNA (guanine527-N7)-methyltransferase